MLHPPCTQILLKVGCSHWSSLACSLNQNPDQKIRFLEQTTLIKQGHHQQCLPLLQLKVCLKPPLSNNVDRTDVLAQCLTDPEHAIHTEKLQGPSLK